MYHTVVTELDSSWTGGTNELTSKYSGINKNVNTLFRHCFRERLHDLVECYTRMRSNAFLVDCIYEWLMNHIDRPIFNIGTEICRINNFFLEKTQAA